MVEQIVDSSAEDRSAPEDWDLEGVRRQLRQSFGIDIPDLTPAALDRTDVQGFRVRLLEIVEERAKQKEARCAELAGRYAEIGYPTLQGWAKQFLLESLDTHWKDHLLNMDHLKEGIGLRGYGQRDPKQEYQKEGFVMFEEMLASMKGDFLERLFKFQPPEPVRADEPPQIVAQARPPKIVLNRGEDAEPRPVKREAVKVGRNDPCPCGSGNKYKRCHGR
jgi:preprotein translocase subunit SecA